MTIKNKKTPRDRSVKTGPWRRASAGFQAFFVASCGGFAVPQFYMNDAKIVVGCGFAGAVARIKAQFQRLLMGFDGVFVHLPFFKNDAPVV